jgi:hypothetical protein
LNHTRSISSNIVLMSFRGGGRGGGGRGAPMRGGGRGFSRGGGRGRGSFDEGPPAEICGNFLSPSKFLRFLFLSKMTYIFRGWGIPS